MFKDVSEDLEFTSTASRVPLTTSPRECASPQRSSTTSEAVGHRAGHRRRRSGTSRNRRPRRWHQRKRHQSPRPHRSCPRRAARSRWPACWASCWWRLVSASVSSVVSRSEIRLSRPAIGQKPSHRIAVASFLGEVQYPRTKEYSDPPPRCQRASDRDICPVPWSRQETPRFRYGRAFGALWLWYSKTGRKFGRDSTTNQGESKCK